MLIKDIYHEYAETITQDTTVADALRELIRDRINGQIVVDDSGAVVGVLSIQDIAAATIPSQFRYNPQMAAAMYRRGFFSEMAQSIAALPVSTIMRRDFMVVNLEDNIMAVTADFLQNDLYIVPVIHDGELLGVVTRSEIKTALGYGMGLEGFEHENI